MAGFTRYQSLEKQVVLITGGAAGIGRSLVEAFVQQGAKVGFIDRDAANAAELMNALLPLYPEGLAFEVADVTDTESFRSALDAIVKALGPISILINNVGDDQRFEFMRMSLQHWHRGFAVNLDPAFITAQMVVPAMQAAKRGVIINISSINALFCPPDLTCYNTAKSALLGFTKSLARDLGGDGIRVNAVLPGWVATPRQLQTWFTPEAEAQWREQLCLKQRIRPEDVANMVLFLASDDAACVTGQQFVVDCGRL